MSRPLRWYDAISINVLWLALTVVAQTNGLVYPLLVQRFAGEQSQGAYLGTLRLWTLMVALLWQAVIGMLSDHSMSRWGRRRPFIISGGLLLIACIALIAASTGMVGMQGYAFLFFAAILLSFAANTAQGGELGLIPDLVPEDMVGRYSAIKAILEAPLPLILVSFTIARLIAAGNTLAGLGLAAAIVLVATLITLGAPEVRYFRERAASIDWAPLFRLAFMTAIFTGMILTMGATVRWFATTLDMVTDPTALMLTIGTAGLAAMVIAVALGVWISVRISIGPEGARQNPAFTWWVVNRLAFLVGSTNLATFAVYFLQGRLGLREEAAAGPAALLMAVVGVCILLSAVPSGMYGDRFGHKRLVVIGGVLGALGAGIVVLAPSMPVIYAGGALIGIATGIFFTSNWALGTKIAPKAEAGRYLGIANLAGAGAGAVGAYIGGPIADFVTRRLDGRPGAGYVLLFCVYGIMFLLSAVAARGIRLRET